MCTVIIDFNINIIFEQALNKDTAYYAYLDNSLPENFVVSMLIDCGTYVKVPSIRLYCS
jgi:hypothetical protein